MPEDVDQLERRLLAAGSLERRYEEQIASMAALVKDLRSANQNTQADAVADAREELRLALKQLKADIATFEVDYYTAARRARR